jgi:hypothetical protein
MRKFDKTINISKVNILNEQRYLSLKENDEPIDYSLDFNGWVNGKKIRVSKALEKINAPTEWKKMVLKSEKLASTAQNMLNRPGGMSWSVREKVEAIGTKWNELMEIIGNTGVLFKPNENTIYWEEYCKLMGTSKNYNFSDLLA